MSYGAERKKLLGTFQHDRGSMDVNIVYEELSVFVGSSKVQLVVPVAMELMTGSVEFRVKAEDLRGFIGLISGNADEFCRSRDIIMRKLEKLGVNIEELP
jgi:hypothetical protein